MSEVLVSIGEKPRLTRSLDKKTALSGNWLPKTDRWAARGVPRFGNAFGLAAGESCPGETEEFCDGCYAKNSENSKGVAAAMAGNLALLQEADSVEGKVRLLSEMVESYLEDLKKFDIPPERHLFRVHWDGDFYSVEYAQAWRIVAEKYPNVNFWAYTRTFGYGDEGIDVVPELLDLDNFALYLSVDPENVEHAKKYVPHNIDRRLFFAYCGIDYLECFQMEKMLYPDKLPEDAAMSCPENAKSKKLELMNEDTQYKGDRFEKNYVGACTLCKACTPLGALKNIYFAKTGREFDEKARSKRESERGKKAQEMLFADVATSGITVVSSGKQR